ncbi:MAG: hypothetical protein HRT57_10115 [Crocinitomicaceae bacterium]|nr:hypothetical protein [Crocinitomicaceae bacterium]
MKYLILIFTFYLGSLLFGQIDTTNIQVIQFSDGLDNRRAWRTFPPDTTTYRKILMCQTLKCDPALIANPTGSGCGEWDTGANFILYDHENTDSLRYNLGGAYPDTVSITSTPIYSYQQVDQNYITYSSILSESTYSLGSGSTSIGTTFNDANANNKAQYLWTAADGIPTKNWTIFLSHIFNKIS